MTENLSYVCPFCESDVLVGQPCPGCASKALKKKRPNGKRIKPWEQDQSADGLNLPNEDFDYNDFVAREFGAKRPHEKTGLKWYWWALAVVILLAMALGLLMR